MGIMKIFVASDHAGFELKGKLVEYLRGKGRDVEDCGPHVLEPADDYPQLIIPCAKLVARLPGSMGIVIGMSGEGEGIAANRISGVRAVVYYGPPQEILKLSREHNNSNVLSLSAKFVTVEEAKAAVDLWLATPFSEEERHVRRIKELG
jgi:ribose 5-phosphate isomerase B